MPVWKASLPSVWQVQYWNEARKWKGKNVDSYQRNWSHFLRVTDDEGEKQTENQCPVLKTLDSSLNESGWEFCFEIKFLFYFFLSFSFIFSLLHPQPVKETAINNRTYFGDFGSEKNLVFLPLGLFIYIKCVLFSIYVILRIDWYIFLWCFYICLKWVVLLESREECSKKVLLRCWESMENWYAHSNLVSRWLSSTIHHSCMWRPQAPIHQSQPPSHEGVPYSLVYQ